MLNVVILLVVILNVIMLIVVVPCFPLTIVLLTEIKNFNATFVARVKYYKDLTPVTHDSN